MAVRATLLCMPRLRGGDIEVDVVYWFHFATLALQKVPLSVVSSKWATNNRLETFWSRFQGMLLKVWSGYLGKLIGFSRLYAALYSLSN